MKLLLVVFIFLISLVLLQFIIRTVTRFSRQANDGRGYQGLLLPDLKLSIPDQLYIELEGKRRFIRFNTTFINQGKGPLEIMGKHDPNRQKTTAIQKILKVDGKFQEKQLGEFVFHPSHEHWHIEKYALFELWSIKENGEPNQVVAATEKMSFCLWDEKSYDLTLENASQTQRYIGCNNEVQGISVGWSDTYDATVEGQKLEIGSLSDGNYLIRSIINPDKKILENEYSNNEATLLVNISANTLSVKE